MTIVVFGARSVASSLGPVPDLVVSVSTGALAYVLVASMIERRSIVAMLKGGT